MIKLGGFMQSDDPGLSKCILQTTKIFLIKERTGKKNRQFKKDETQMINKHMETYSASLVVREL